MDEKKEEAVVPAPVPPIEAPEAPPVDPIAEKDKEIARLTEELGNYKNVALKRLGKLPGDADFIAGVDEKTGLTIEETVRKTLLEQAIIKTEADKNAEVARLVKENSELKLALKNRPGAPIGAGGGESPEVKDNVFSAEQIEALRQKAIRLKADPEKFIENAKKNLQAHR